MRGDANAIQATFEGWKLPAGTSVKGPFAIEIKLSGSGRNWRYCPVLLPTRQPFFDERGSKLTFAESKLDEGKAQIAKMFEKQLTPWDNENPRPRPKPKAGVFHE